MACVAVTCIDKLVVDSTVDIWLTGLLTTRLSLGYEFMVSEILYPGVDQTEVHIDTAEDVSKVDVVTVGVVLAGIFSRKLINAPTNCDMSDDVLVATCSCVGTAVSLRVKISLTASDSMS